MIRPQLRYNTVRIADTRAEWEANGGVALGDLSVEWGRGGVYDDTTPTTVEFSLLHRTTSGLQTRSILPDAAIPYEVWAIDDTTRWEMKIAEAYVQSSTVTLVDSDDKGDIWKVTCTCVDTMAALARNTLSPTSWWDTNSFTQSDMFDIALPNLYNRIDFYVPVVSANAKVALFAGREEPIPLLDAVTEFYKAFDAGSWTFDPVARRVYPTGPKIVTENRQLELSGNAFRLFSTYRSQTETTNAKNQRATRSISAFDLDACEIKVDTIEFTAGPEYRVNWVRAKGVDADGKETVITASQGSSKDIPLEWDSHLLHDGSTQVLASRVASQLTTNAQLPKHPEIKFRGEDLPQDAEFWLTAWEDNRIANISGSKIVEYMRDVLGWRPAPLLTPIGGHIAWDGARWDIRLTPTWVATTGLGATAVAWSGLDNRMNWTSTPSIESSLTWGDFETIY